MPTDRSGLGVAAAFCVLSALSACGGDSGGAAAAADATDAGGGGDAAADAVSDVAVDPDGQPADSAVDGPDAGVPDAAGDAAADTGESARATIGSGGGSLASPDGILTLDFPAGALSQDTVIAITPLPVEEGVSYQLEPDGLELAEAATATFTFGAEDLAGLALDDTDDTFDRSGPGLYLLLTATGGDPEIPEGVAVAFDYDPIQAVLTAPIEHFSTATIPGPAVAIQATGPSTVSVGGEVGVETTIDAFDQARAVQLRRLASVQGTSSAQEVLRPAARQTVNIDLDEVDPAVLLQRMKCLRGGESQVHVEARIEYVVHDSVNALGIDYSLNLGTLGCTAATTGTSHATIAGPEAITLAPTGSFGTSDIKAVISGSGGVALQLIDTGVTAFDLGFLGSEYAALPVSGETDTGTVEALVSVGSTGYGITSFQEGEFGFTLTAVPSFNATDVQPIDGSSSFLIVNNGGNRVLVLDFDAGAGSWNESFTRGVHAAALAGAPGNVVSAVVLDSNGTVLLAQDGTPGALALADLDTPDAAAVSLGAVGNSPRGLACDAASGLCAVAAYASNTISIVMNNPDTVLAETPIPVGDGPVRVHVRSDGGGGAYVLTTGTHDDTLTQVDVDSDGALVSSATDTLEGCQGPVAAIPHPNGEQVIVVCHDNDTYVIVPPPSD